MITHDEKLHIIRAMRTRGGSFVQALGAAWLLADDENCRRIEATFNEYIATYRQIALTMIREPQP